MLYQFHTHPPTHYHHHHHALKRASYRQKRSRAPNRPWYRHRLVPKSHSLQKRSRAPNRPWYRHRLAPKSHALQKCSRAPNRPWCRHSLAPKSRALQKRSALGLQRGPRTDNQHRQCHQARTELALAPRIHALQKRSRAHDPQTASCRQPISPFRAFIFVLYIKCGSYLLVVLVYLFIRNVVCECNIAF